jgi:hypothetical protein
MNKCGKCGREVESSVWVDEVPFCEQCYLALDTCRACQAAQTCPFEQDTTVTEPPIVQQTIRKGNAILSTTVKNPKRIELTCAAKCPCYSPENGCMKEYGWCDKYAEV